MIRNSFALLSAVTLAAASGAIVAQKATAQPSSGRIPLAGQWRFATDPNDVGVRDRWFAMDSPDSAWQTIKVPGYWEDHGVTAANARWKRDDMKQPYSGYAWYRRTFFVPKEWRSNAHVVYLNLGRVDDWDWTYVNGVKIGSISEGKTWVDQVSRTYRIPLDVLHFGKNNVIAVRVLDIRGVGGLTDAPSVTLNVPAAPAPARAGGKGTDVVVMGRRAEVRAGETVADVVSVGGSIIVRAGAHVTGDVVAVGGRIKLERDSTIDGDVVTVGTPLQADPTASVLGEKVQVLSFIGPVDDLTRQVNVGMLGLTSLATAMVLALALGLLFVTVFPRQMDLVATTVLEQPGRAGLYGVIAAAMVVPLALALTVTVIGIPLVAVEMALVVVGYLVGKLGVALAVGRRLGQSVAPTVASHAALLAVGVLILGMLCFVPVVGVLLLFALTVLGFGAAVMTGLGTSPTWLTDRWTGRHRHVPYAPSHIPAPPARPEQTGTTAGRAED